MKNKKRILYVIIPIVIIVLAVLSYSYIRIKQDTDLQEITLEEFQKLIDDNQSESKYIYVGRSTCPSCDVVYPELCKISQNKKLIILYYNTAQDRDTNADEMYSLLDKLGVDTIPTVIKIRDSLVVEKYTGEEFVDSYKM